MSNYTWTDEDVKFVEKAIEIKNKGYYCDGKQLTEVYNRVLHKSVNPTNCGSCLRQRVTELEGALNAFKKQIENNNTQIEKEDVITSGQPSKPITTEKRKKGKSKTTG